MKRRALLQAGLATAGATALGLNEAHAIKPKRHPYTPMLELTTTYSPETRPFMLVTMMLAVKPDDFKRRWSRDHEAEAEAIAKARAAPSMVDGVPQFELYSCPTYNKRPSQLVENFQVALDHYFESQGRTPVLYKPVEFTFYGGNGLWLESNHTSTVVAHAHDIFENRSHDAIENAVYQRAMFYFHDSGLQAENTRVSSDWREGAKNYNVWLAKQRKHLTAVGVRFYVL